MDHDHLFRVAQAILYLVLMGVGFAMLFAQQQSICHSINEGRKQNNIRAEILSDLLLTAADARDREGHHDVADKYRMLNRRIKIVPYADCTIT